MTRCRWYPIDAEAATVNISSKVPIPPGSAMHTSLFSIIICFRSLRFAHLISWSTKCDIFPFSSIISGTTPMVSPPASFVAWAMHSISPSLHPPKTMEWRFFAKKTPNSLVFSKKTVSKLLFAEQ